MRFGYYLSVLVDCETLIEGFESERRPVKRIKWWKWADIITTLAWGFFLNLIGWLMFMLIWWNKYCFHIDSLDDKKVSLDCGVVWFEESRIFRLPQISSFHSVPQQQQQQQTLMCGDSSWEVQEKRGGISQSLNLSSAINRVNVRKVCQLLRTFWHLCVDCARDSFTWRHFRLSPNFYSLNKQTSQLVVLRIASA